MTEEDVTRVFLGPVMESGWSVRSYLRGRVLEIGLMKTSWGSIISVQNA